MVLVDVIMCREQEAASATRWITNRQAPVLWRYRIHDGGDERARREVLARAAFHVLGVLLQQTPRTRLLSRRRKGWTIAPYQLNRR